MAEQDWGELEALLADVAVPLLRALRGRPENIHDAVQAAFDLAQAAPRFTHADGEAAAEALAARIRDRADDWAGCVNAGLRLAAAALDGNNSQMSAAESDLLDLVVLRRSLRQ